MGVPKFSRLLQFSTHLCCPTHGITILSGFVKALLCLSSALGDKIRF